MVRKEEESALHDRAIVDIAKIRYSFPDKDHPSWRTFTNQNGEQNKGIQKNQDIVYPDIVVVDTAKNMAAMVGEVETGSTVNEDESVQWKEYSFVCSTFYIYVPNGYDSEAKRIIESEGIRCSGLRTYEYDSEGKIVIRNI